MLYWNATFTAFRNLNASITRLRFFWKSLQFVQTPENWMKSPRSRVIWCSFGMKLLNSKIKSTCSLNKLLTFALKISYIKRVLLNYLLLWHISLILNSKAWIEPEPWKSLVENVLKFNYAGFYYARYVWLYII